MATNLPLTLDDFSGQVGTDTSPLGTPNHRVHHQNLQDAVAELEKVAVGPIVVNVKGLGALGNGVQDDGPYIAQAMILAGTGGTVYFPPGIYRITAPIDIASNRGGIQFVGTSRTKSIIRQHTANTPIFRCAEPAESVTIANLLLTYNAQATTSHPGSYAIQFAGGSGSSAEYINWRFVNLRIERCFVGIGILATATGKAISVGNAYFESLVFADYAYSGMNFQSPNTAYSRNNAANALQFISTGVLHFSGAMNLKNTDLSIVGMEIRGQINAGILVDEGMVNIVGLRVFGHTWSTNTRSVLTVTNYGSLNITGLRQDGGTIAATNATMLTATAGGVAYVVDWTQGTQTISSGSFRLLNCAAGTSVRVLNMRGGAGIWFGVTTGLVEFKQIPFDGGPWAPLNDGDPTPSVWGLEKVYVLNTSATTITAFDDGYSGQVILVRFLDLVTTLNQTGNISLTGATSYTPNTGKVMMQFVYDGSKWQELSRSVN